MSRRIFEERGFCLSGKVLPYEDFKPFLNQKNGFEIDKEQKPRLIKEAEKALSTEIPQLYAHEYMMFCRNGNRTVYEDACFLRRDMLLALAVGEYTERKGRFTDKIIDLIWLILEETTWVIPAHNPTKAGKNCCLPYAYSGEVDFIDLFSATTAATLAWCYYLCRDILDSASTLITERILFELDRRIIKPYLNEEHLKNNCHWSGLLGNEVSNWAPWIVSNVLTVTALTVKETDVRSDVITRSLTILDNFTSFYHEDGGCNEGPHYWTAAGGALFSASLLLYDMTGGYVNVFDDPLIKNMGEYAVKVVVTDTRVLNFADSPSKIDINPLIYYHWGVACDSEMLKAYGNLKLNGGLCDVTANTKFTYLWMKYITTPRLNGEPFIPEKHCFIGGIDVAISREEGSLDKGLFLALKGGHNGESHNHNDLGNIVVFADGKPIFIDAGCGRYTKKTFSPERYTIWSMRSDYHNCATFNGIAQRSGKDAAASDTLYDRSTGKMSLNLTAAYPKEANLEKYVRTAELVGSVITVVDDVILADKGEVTFSFITRTAPEKVSESSFIIEGREVSFDSSLGYAIEELDKTEPEVIDIPSGWNADVLYRITLTSKSPVKEKKYVLSVK